jgi:hypothetical protein
MRSSAHIFRTPTVEIHSDNHIALKKPNYPVVDGLARYLAKHGRNTKIPIAYEDLLRHDGLMAQTDPDGKETLWTTVMLRPSEMQDTHDRLVELYQVLIGYGRTLPYLRVASIDFCGYGNSQPFRIKILNQINDNHDYYYIKKADASRVYGLELEHLLSPNKINYICTGTTLVEEHIIGVPGDDFMKDPQKYGGNFNPVRLCKEFVKFNERCFVRLLGDMRAYNFVVDVTQDFDQAQYRLRSIDFDQQSFEGPAPHLPAAVLQGKPRFRGICRAIHKPGNCGTVCPRRAFPVKETLPSGRRSSKGTTGCNAQRRDQPSGACGITAQRIGPVSQPSRFQELHHHGRYSGHAVEGDVGSVICDWLVFD